MTGSLPPSQLRYQDPIQGDWRTWTAECREVIETVFEELRSGATFEGREACLGLLRHLASGTIITLPCLRPRHSNRKPET